MTQTAAPSLLSVLQGLNPSPFDLASFSKFCSQLFAEENVDFWLAVESLRRVQDRGQYEDALGTLRHKFIMSDGEATLNICGELRTKTLLNIEQALMRMSAQGNITDNSDTDNDKKMSYNNDNIIDTTILDEVQNEVFKMIALDTYSRYISKITATIQLRLARKQALWWREWRTITAKEFFSFPSPVSDADARIHAFFQMLIIPTIIVLDIFTVGSNWLIIYMTAGFFLRTLCGPRLDIQAMAVLFIFRPLCDHLRIFKNEHYVPGGTRRIAQLVGFIFSFTASIILLATHHAWIAGYAVLGCLFIACFLNAVFNLCLVCVAAAWAVRRGLLGPEACKECSISFVSFNSSENSYNVRSVRSPSLLAIKDYV